LINDLMYVLINDLMYDLINDVMYVLINDLLHIKKMILYICWFLFLSSFFVTIFC